MGFRKLGEPFAVLGGGGLGKGSGKGIFWNQFATFEAGAVTPYPTGADTTGGVGANLAATAAAAMRGSFGLAVTTAGVGSDAFVQFDGPQDENCIVIDYLFDPNSIVMGGADNFNMFIANGSGPGGAAFLQNFRIVAGNYTIQSLVRNDAGGNADSLIHIVQDNAMQIRLEWGASSAPGADDGYIRFWIDGVLIWASMFIDNDQQDVDNLRFGATAIDAGTSGAIYFDNIRWNNQMVC